MVCIENSVLKVVLSIETCDKSTSIRSCANNENIDVFRILSSIMYPTQLQGAMLANIALGMFVEKGR